MAVTPDITDVADYAPRDDVDALAKHVDALVAALKHTFLGRIRLPLAERDQDTMINAAIVNVTYPDSTTKITIDNPLGRRPGGIIVLDRMYGIDEEYGFYKDLVDLNYTHGSDQVTASSLPEDYTGGFVAPRAASQPGKYPVVAQSGTTLTLQQPWEGPTATYTSACFVAQTESELTLAVSDAVAGGGWVQLLVF